MDERALQAKDPKSMMLRFHTQTAGVSLTAQQPEINIARTAMKHLLESSAVRKAFIPIRWMKRWLPTEKAARIALRTQQVIAHETGVTDVVDPLGGNWFLEELTDRLEAEAESISHIAQAGSDSMLEGAFELIDEGWYQGNITDAAYDFEEINAGRRIVVGVNDFTEGNEEDQIELLALSRRTTADKESPSSEERPRPTSRRQCVGCPQSAAETDAN